MKSGLPLKLKLSMLYLVIFTQVCIILSVSHGSDKLEYKKAMEIQQYNVILVIKHK